MKIKNKSTFWPLERFLSEVVTLKTKQQFSYPSPNTESILELDSSSLLNLAIRLKLLFILKLDSPTKSDTWSPKEELAGKSWSSSAVITWPAENEKTLLPMVPSLFNWFFL